MNEKQFIEQESKKHEIKLKKMLREIKKKGFSSNSTVELLLINRFIHFVPGNVRNKYNHYELTEKGEEVLNGKESSSLVDVLYRVMLVFIESWESGDGLSSAARKVTLDIAAALVDAGEDINDYRMAIESIKESLE